MIEKIVVRDAKGKETYRKITRLDVKTKKRTVIKEEKYNKKEKRWLSIKESK